VGASIALAACAPRISRTTAEPGGQPAKIAIMTPITGSAAWIGEQQLNFARLAVEEFNRAHGTGIGLVEGDTQLSPATAATLAQRLVSDDRVYAIVRPAGSQEVSAATPIAALANLAMISPSATNTELTEQGWRHFFRVVPRDDVQGPTAATFIVDQLGARMVWVIDDQSSYSKGLADQAERVLRQRGVAIRRESVSQSDTDFSALVTRVKAGQPDVLFIPFQVASQAALLARQLGEQGVGARLVGGDGLFSVEEFITAAAGASEGAYASFFAPDVSAVEAARPILETYRARHGEVGPFGASAYAATMVALEAIQRVRESGTLSREAVVAEIACTDQPTSILGTPIAFDAKGDVKDATFFIFQVRGGKFEPIRIGT
jgi:branched-chain amino acid transport system substrate-binding protein